MTVALVLVSHAAEVAEGTARIAREMAPDVVVLAAGGIDGGLGTSADTVLAAVEDAAGRAGGDGVVVLTDLGSAVLTAESVVEMLDDDVAARVRVPDAPLVEGAVAAAVAAQLGGDVDAVARAATRAGVVAPTGGGPGEPDAPARAGGTSAESLDGDDVVERPATLRNPLGLHARPAAVVARTVGRLGADVRVDGVNAASVLELMQLAATGGRTLSVTGRGAGAADVVAEVVQLLESGFGEV